MEYKMLNQTELKVSKLCLGCWSFENGGTFGVQADHESIQTIHRALELGVNFLDTAEGYNRGYSENVVGKALEGQRHNVVLATKVNAQNLRQDKLIAACEGSLKRLRTDYIDLYQIHWPNHDVPIEESLSALERLKAQGKIRYYGVSNFGPVDIEDFSKKAKVKVTNQVCYNLLFRSIEDALLPATIKSGMRILSYSSLAQGLLADIYQSAADVIPGKIRVHHLENEAIRALTFETLNSLRALAKEWSIAMPDFATAWLLKKPFIDAVLIGAQSPLIVEANVRSLEAKLTEEMEAQLNYATAALKSTLHGQCDMWENRIM
ncbi:MAG: aldo/keto reductase [Candidatus Cloacimonetes bacterium]|nr:aldo/keto reductase [Candidatus Cloacimonadota bacterium]